MLPGWLNENSYRDYPFQPNSGVWQDAVADMGVLLGPRPDTVAGTFSNFNKESDFDPTVNKVSLSSIHNTGTETVYTFVLGASLPGNTLTFRCQNSDPPFLTYLAQSIVGSVLIWEGFMVTGYRTDTLAGLASLPSNTYTAGSSTILEPSLIQDLSRRQVTSISLANFPRVVVTDPPGCSLVSAAHDVSGAPSSDIKYEAVVFATNIQGSVKLREGFNTTIRQEAGSNSIVIGGAVGAGAGLVCHEIAIAADQSSHAGHLLTGGPKCSEVLQTLNGVGGTNIRISAGKGFHVQPSDTTPHTLVIAAKATDFAVCLQ
jgi:hypothetical protein